MKRCSQSAEKQNSKNPNSPLKKTIQTIGLGFTDRSSAFDIIAGEVIWGSLMPREIRKIVFSDTELHQVMDRYRQTDPHRFPSGRLTACQADPEGIKLFFRSRDASRASTCHLISRPEAMRILIQFCLEQRIPLPREGTKRLGLVDGMVCLHIELTSNLHQQNAGSKLSA